MAKAPFLPVAVIRHGAATGFLSAPTGHHGTTPNPRQDNMAGSRPAKDDALIEIGAKAIYEFRAHPRRATWDAVSAEKKAMLRERMRSLLATLDENGVNVKRVK